MAVKEKYINDLKEVLEMARRNMRYIVTKRNVYSGETRTVFRTNEREKAEEFCSQFSRCGNSAEAYIDSYGNVFRIQYTFV